MKERGGFTGDYDYLVMCVKRFFNEAAYQLCDGFAVDTGFFSVHPVVGGYFDTADGDREPKKHPVTFRFRAREPLLRLAEHIAVEVQRPSAGGNIDRFLDGESGTVNGTITPGGEFILCGDKIKVAGDNPEVGVYFVSQAEPSVRYKVAKRPLVNTRRKIISRAPPLPTGEYSIEVQTQYTVGGINLHEPRTVTAGFTVRAG